MKNTKSRKKMLMSSVAMLLVALIALGTATFAWFAANPYADASGLKLKTTASTGLVARTDSDTEWSHNALLYCNGKTGANKAALTDPFNLNPVSQEQTAEKADTFYTVVAKDAGAYDADTSQDMGTGSKTTWTAASGENDGSFSKADVYQENVYFRLSDGSDAASATTKEVKINKVTITPKAGIAADDSMQNAIRVAIVDSSKNLLGTYALDTATTHVDGTMHPTSETDLKPAKGTFDPPLVASVAADATFATSVSTGITGLTTNSTNLTKYVTVYVYLDGQDKLTYSNKVGTVNCNEFISGISVGFELV